MTGIEAIGPLVLGADPAIGQLAMPLATGPVATPTASFGQILTDGMRQVETKMANANDLVRQFALDDSVPLHKVTYALEEARLAVELAMQVRTRLVESYRELMNMQL